MNITLLSNSPEETQGLGRAIGRCLRGTELILLDGPLGAGKTLFTKGLAQALDIPPAEVVSPSYVLMSLLDGKFRLYHFDLYRLGEGGGFDSGIDEYFDCGVLVVEWAQYLPPVYFSLPGSITVRFRPESDEKRRLEVQTALPYVVLP